MLEGRMKPFRVVSGWLSLGASEAVLGGRGNAVFGLAALSCAGLLSLGTKGADLGGKGNPFIALSSGEKAAADELLPVPSPPSDDLMSDSPELREYADSRLDSDPEGDAGSGGGWGVAAGFATGLLGMDIGGTAGGAGLCCGLGFAGSGAAWTWGCCCG